MISRSFSLPALVIGYLLSSTGRVAAQAAEVRNLATDTLQLANASYQLPVSRLGTVTGQVLHVFLNETAERKDALEFTWRHPLSLPRPRPVVIKLAQVQWVLIRGQYYEPVRLLGAKAQLLAWRHAAGPKVELFDIAWPKTKATSFIPVAGPFIQVFSKLDSTSLNHYWFLRRPGQQNMVFVPADKHFAPFLADYLADAPELAAAIRAGAEGHRYNNVPALLAAYNKLTQAPH